VRLYGGSGGAHCISFEHEMVACMFTIAWLLYCPPSVHLGVRRRPPLHHNHPSCPQHTHPSVLSAFLPTSICSELLKPENFEVATTEIFGPFQVSTTARAQQEGQLSSRDGHQQRFSPRCRAARVAARVLCCAAPAVCSELLCTGLYCRW